MQITDEILTRAEHMQDGFHKHIREISELCNAKNSPVPDYDSLQQVWNYQILAELELRIEKLENNPQYNNQSYGYSSNCPGENK